ncbi:uncharacterized protein LOC143364103 [Halictus rubicundus]|uniref:uncharacterized protein LOC143364103 n=1 Tax=Halictus rubicundus TaxID=77578 RepID=UPI0040354C17
MEAQFKGLISERGAAKAKLTIFRKFVESADVNADIVSFEKRVRTNEGLYDKFDRIQTQIEASVVGTPALETHLAEREQFENTYFNTLSHAETRLIAARGESASNSASTSNPTPTPSDSYPAIRLPVIKIPTFDGNYSQWIRFRDTFTSLVHDCDKLNDIDRFNYLVSSLSGPAARILESFGVSATNYKLAWSRLRQRYDDPKFLVAHHVNSLLDLEPLSRKSSGKALSEFVDSAVNNVRALESLLNPAEIWDALISTYLARKLDTASLDDWEKRTMESKVLPSFNDFAAFLETRSQYLERRDSSKPSVAIAVSDRTPFPRNREISKKPFVATSHVASKSSKCGLCDGEHALQNCTKLLAMSHVERHAALKRARVCFNCLGMGHSVKSCTRGNCRKCGKKHHTLLHREEAISVPEHQTEESPSSSHVGHACHTSSANLEAEYVVLSTAVVYVTDSKGRKHKCRALLDSGSQINSISQNLAQKLDLPHRTINTSISGFNSSKTRIRSSIELKMSSIRGNFSSSLSCLVVQDITENMPNVPLHRFNVPVPPGTYPADPEFYSSGRIDLLIGAGIFWNLLCVGQVKIGLGNLAWQKTRLGWILGGQLSWSSPKDKCRSGRTCNLISNTELHNSMTRFWEVDEACDRKPVVLETDICEQHFVKNTTRDDHGRFIMAIPFNNRLLELGESRAQAERRLLNLERKFRKNPDLRTEYSNFIREYLELGHMNRIDEVSAATISNCFYLPHHAVFKDSSTTTKLRVVFDGSAKSTTGISRNDAELVGPIVQDELFSILLRFRKFKIVLSADIAKMYRQVLVRKEDRRYQLILWRFREEDNIDTYSLNTVTYGTASASYLATRALHQVGIDCARSSPHASDVILHDFYVDDLLTGCDTVDEAIALRESLERILAKAGFSLRKWASNDPKSIGHVSGVTQNLEFRILDKEPKTLGLLWSVSSDQLSYSAQIRKHTRITKRNILAEIAQIFDPLGLIGPVIVKSKLFMQELWQMKVGWDETLSQDLHLRWLNFRTELDELSSVKIPRLALFSNLDIEIHGFSDASEKAYGAAVYVRSRRSDGTWVARLLCAKSRVAPLKSVSIPRLELCGALLMAQLIEKVRRSLRIVSMREYCWTDSQIVLAWLAERPCRWKVFVANRAAEIHKLTASSTWKHVRTADNPADILSRGSSAPLLIGHDLWWYGPSWLSLDAKDWPIPDASIVDVPDARPMSIVQLSVTTNRSPLIVKLLERFSSYDKLLRVIAYLFRFPTNCRNAHGSSTGHRGSPSVSELTSAERVLIRAAHAHYFDSDYRSLAQQREINKNSPLVSLHPYLDEHGLIRVGGRLENAPVPYEQKHPIVIPKSGPLAELIVRREHFRLLHAGGQQTLASLHSRYWIISGRRIVRKVLRRCVTCFRTGPVSAQPLMGNLPADRVTPARPFHTCGVDYAGPLLVVDRGRSRTARKAYICIFVCMATKAIHLELAVDLTTDAFISCLRRFIARRGKCKVIHSDNGTNFVGARNELRELGALIGSEAHNCTISALLAKEQIEWRLIPPRAPHFGGLWERGVRSVKTHLKRIVGEQRLTFDELYTLLTQVEACLNSRPIHPLSADPSDLNPLTPGHFLIGDALTALPQVDLTAVRQNRLCRFQLVQQMLQHFWKRWCREYLNGLQQRHKWKVDSPVEPRTGAMVLIQEDNLPPMKWMLGRILELHPGQDGKTRVVSLRTASGTLKRPVTKICFLPIAENDSESLL